MADLTSPLMLNPRVTIRPVAEYPLTVQERLSGKSNDYIVSESRSRYSAMRVSADTAELLKLFSQPRLAAEVICEFSLARSLEPGEVLMEAYKTLLEFCSLNILLTPEEGSRGSINVSTPRFSPGDTVDGFTVVGLMESTTETEIYQVRSGIRKRAALKFIPESAPVFVRKAAARECRILTYLKAAGFRGAPELLLKKRSGHGYRIYLPWIEGRALNYVARDPDLSLPRRLAITKKIALIYARLHKFRTLHGDVHGGNILVGRRDTVHLIDFGAAETAHLALPRIPRIGLTEEYEPEAAGKMLDGGDLPRPSPLGEQYCVANMIALTMTGRPALALPLEHDAAIREIMEQPPRVWDFQSLRHCSGVEKVVRKALSKAPGDRFSSMTEFARSLAREVDAALISIAADGKQVSAARSGKRRESVSPVQVIKALWGLESPSIESRLPHEPLSSVYYGSAGIALGLLRSSILSEDPELLAASEIWLRRAFAEQHGPDAFNGEKLGVRREHVGRHSVLNSEVGLHYTGVLLSLARGDETAVTRMTGEFSRILSGALKKDCFEDRFALDLAAGLPGLLLAARRLVASLPPGCEAAAMLLEKECRRMSGKLQTRLAACIGDQNLAGEYLGFAHGVAGSLFALLTCGPSSGPSGRVLEAGLARLQKEAAKSGDGCSWPVRLDGKYSSGWTGWCHGSAGYILLWNEAGVRLQEEQYIQLAIQSGNFAWNNRRMSGASLCCGGAGLALSFCRLGHSTNDSLWFKRAASLLNDKTQDQRDMCAPMSLFRGSLGAELAKLELAMPEKAAFPVCHGPFR